MRIHDLTYDQCVAQGVGPLLFPDRLTGDRVGEMKQICLQNIRNQVKLQHTLAIAWEGLKQADIQPVLMKGAGLAAYYPEPQRRQWGDIDLFVGKEQYHPACAAMRKTFPEALRFDEELDHYKHYNLIADGVAMEVHRVSMSLTHPRDIRRYEAFEREGMENSESVNLDGLTVRVPEVTFNVLMVFLHSWEHFLFAGVKLQHLYDLFFLLRGEKERIDRLRLKRYLEALRLMEPWQLYMYATVNLLGLAEENAPFYTAACAERAERMISDILSGHSVAPSSPSGKKYRNRFLRKWQTMRTRMANAERIAQYSPAYARHMKAGVWLSGLSRIFAPDRHWE